MLEKECDSCTQSE